MQVAQFEGLLARHAVIESSDCQINRKARNLGQDADTPKRHYPSEFASWRTSCSGRKPGNPSNEHGSSWEFAAGWGVGRLAKVTNAFRLQLSLQWHV